MDGHIPSILLKPNTPYNSLVRKTPVGGAGGGWADPGAEAPAPEHERAQPCYGSRAPSGSGGGGWVAAPGGGEGGRA